MLLVIPFVASNQKANTNLTFLIDLLKEPLFYYDISKAPYESSDPYPYYAKHRKYKELKRC